MAKYRNSVEMGAIFSLLSFLLSCLSLQQPHNRGSSVGLGGGKRETIGFFFPFKLQNASKKRGGGVSFLGAEIFRTLLVVGN